MARVNIINADSSSAILKPITTPAMAWIPWCHQGPISGVVTSNINHQEGAGRRAWISDNDWEIITDSDGGKTVITCDGDKILYVNSNWSDAQIHTAMRMANWTYAIGYKAGKRDKVNEFKKAMEIE